MVNMRITDPLLLVVTAPWLVTAADSARPRGVGPDCELALSFTQVPRKLTLDHSC